MGATWPHRSGGIDVNDIFVPLKAKFADASSRLYG
jgi:hypothetical protein